jgi:hypothetical protein
MEPAIVVTPPSLEFDFEKLDRMRQTIEGYPLQKQIEVLHILQNTKLNESKNGIIINMSCLDQDVCCQLEKYIEYSEKQEKELTKFEDEKNNLIQLYFSNHQVANDKIDST